MPSLNNRHCHQITLNLLKTTNLSSAICPMHLTWRHLQWWISHVAVYVKKIFLKTYVVRGLVWLQWHISSSVCTCNWCLSEWMDTQLCSTVPIGLLSFSLRKFLQACSGSSQSLPIDQTLLIWLRVPKHHKNGEWTAAVWKRDLICKDQRP